MRILRLALITMLLVYLMPLISHWLRQHVPEGIFITAGTIGVLDEYAMRLLPAKVEPAAQGGFSTS
jgi:hypothetical protein